MTAAVSTQDQHLIDAAEAAIRERGDGTRHTVGAALLSGDGTITAGVNVFAQGGGACAELVALGSAISRGQSDFQTIVAVGDAGRGVIGPCGVCRQLLLDYAPAIDVILPGNTGTVKVAIDGLMPLANRSWFASNQ